MPPWVAAVSRSTLLRSGGAIDGLPCIFRCHKAPSLRLTNRLVRSVSTIVSPTEINLRPNIPPENKELYTALSALERAAGKHVNSSRVQLALQGLTAQDAVIRVAVIGLNSQASAQRLTRLLLADPLGTEEAWEKELGKPDDGDQRPFLIKYGEDSDMDPPTPLHRVLSVPSRILKSHNLEILVSSMTVHANAVVSGLKESSNNSLLVPTLQDISPDDPPVPYPVHKTLMLGEGLDGAIAFGRFSSGNIDEAGDMVRVAVNLAIPSKQQDQAPVHTTTAIDMDVGMKALASFRESVENSITYERGWFQSGLPALSTWLIEDLQPSEPTKPIVKMLVASIVLDVESSITKADAARLQKVDLMPTEHDITVPILAQLESWAEKSHAELRDQLDEAFSARSWHGLSWWKLLWRVDDVTMISSDILERKWLVSAEKNSVYLAGRMNQAGFPDDIQKLAPSAVLEKTLKDPGSAPENTQTDLSTDVRIPGPWPEYISTARAELITDTVPALQTLAQRLLLQTFSTASLSSALSALLYVSVSSISLFEASTIAALGLTFSLRRMQKLWEGARESWQATIREEGRRTLKETEETVRMIVKIYRRETMGEDDDGLMQREARDAVTRVKNALDKMDKPV